MWHYFIAKIMGRVYTKAILVHHSCEFSYDKSQCKLNLHMVVFFLAISKYDIITRIKTKKGK